MRNLLLLPLLLLVAIVTGGWSSPPQVYQCFKFSYWCATGYSITIIQYTSRDYVYNVPSGYRLDNRRPTDNTVCIAPPTAVAQMVMREKNFLAYYIVAKKANGDQCWSKKIYQRDLDLMNAEFKRQNATATDRTVVLQIGGACCIGNG